MVQQVNPWNLTARHRILIMVKVCAEPAKHFGRDKSREFVHSVPQGPQMTLMF